MDRICQKKDLEEEQTKLRELPTNVGMEAHKRRNRNQRTADGNRNMVLETMLEHEIGVFLRTQACPGIRIRLERHKDLATVVGGVSVSGDMTG